MSEEEARHYVLETEPFEINLSSYAFGQWAKQYYECRLLFKCDSFSPVPYFLLCRAIELHFKAIHLENRRQKHVKNVYSHDLIKSYNDLSPTEQTLSREEFSLLDKANKIYKDKGFEYINVAHALRAFSDFPDLNALDALAAKIIVN